MNIAAEFPLQTETDKNTMTEDWKAELDEWKWPARPTTEHEFDQMMTSLDRHLGAKGFEPSQRGIHASRQISWTLGLDGTPIFGGSKDHGTPFSPVDLLARVQDWYTAYYADAMKVDWSPGSTLLVIDDNLWKLRFPALWGSGAVVVDRDLSECGKDVISKGPATYNVLCSVEGLTQAFASKLSDDALDIIYQAFRAGWQAIMSFDALSGHVFFDEARADYRHSVDAIASGREYGKGRWETAQCAEKVLKGLLATAGHAYPDRGAKGHDHVYLGSLVDEKLGIKIDAQLLSTLKISPAVRYGEEPSTREQAIESHCALINLFLDISSHNYIRQS